LLTRLLAKFVVSSNWSNVN